MLPPIINYKDSRPYKWAEIESMKLQCVKLLYYSAILKNAIAQINSIWRDINAFYPDSSFQIYIVMLVCKTQWDSSKINANGDDGRF